MDMRSVNSYLEALHPKEEWLRWAAPRVGAAMPVAWSASPRRPRLSLYVAAVAVMVLPLVPDLFYVIPWPYRRAAGFVAFVAVVCVCVGRILLVREGDDVPPQDDVRSPRWLAWVLPLVCGALAV